MSKHLSSNLRSIVSSKEHELSVMRGAKRAIEEMEKEISDLKKKNRNLSDEIRSEKEKTMEIKHAFDQKCDLLDQWEAWHDWQERQNAESNGEEETDSKRARS